MREDTFNVITNQQQKINKSSINKIYNAKQHRNDEDRRCCEM
jgi:hypothetical protein